MANRNCGGSRRREIRSIPAVPPPEEPEMRRWPHPVAAAPEELSPTLHYVCCALSYQNQLLADIKALLERQGPSNQNDSGL